MYQDEREFTRKAGYPEWRITLRRQGVSCYIPADSLFEAVAKIWKILRFYGKFDAWVKITLENKPYYWPEDEE